MVRLEEMHINEIKHRIGVLTAIKNSLEFTGRVLPENDKTKLAALTNELNRRA